MTKFTDEDWSNTNNQLLKLRCNLPEAWFINITIHPFDDTTLIFGIRER